jgi:uncharacterized membrane protein YeaQ/YmgE (transglycosylase-associated protein family)
MQFIPLIGGMIGYLVACLLSGHLLPPLSLPSLIGVVVGGAIALVVVIASWRGQGDVF